MRANKRTIKNYLIWLLRENWLLKKLFSKRSILRGIFNALSTNQCLRATLFTRPDIVQACSKSLTMNKKGLTFPADLLIISSILLAQSNQFSIPFEGPKTWPKTWQLDLCSKIRIWDKRNVRYYRVFVKTEFVITELDLMSVLLVISSVYAFWIRNFRQKIYQTSELLKKCWMSSTCLKFRSIQCKKMILIQINTLFEPWDILMNSPKVSFITVKKYW